MHYLITLKQPIACENGRMCAKIWREMDRDDLKRFVPDDNFLGAIEHPKRPTALDVYCATPKADAERIAELQDEVRDLRRSLGELGARYAQAEGRAGTAEKDAAAVRKELAQLHDENAKLNDATREAVNSLTPYTRDRAVLSDAIREAITSLELYNCLGWRKSGMHRVAVDLRSALLDTAL